MTTLKIASGHTKPGETAWQPYVTPGLYVDVDTSAAGFSTTPVYITSMGGDSSHWMTTGATSIYQPTPKGFRVYVRWADGHSGLTSEQANGWKWHINWIGIEG